MKKSLKALLLSLSCICLTAATAAFVGCKDPQDSSSSDSTPPSSERPEGTLEVDFVDGEGYSFVSDIKDGELAVPGDVVSFSVKVGAFYTGYPVVSVNGTAIAPDEDGVYKVEMSEAIEVTVTGLRKDVSNMAGNGSFEDAYVVTRPIDLLYIAEQVNKGVQSYVTGAYVLANDIDCGGEELQVIGDMSTENSFFSGCFTCYTDPNTGEMISNTISNFVINSETANYVGLFGTVYADLSVTSSGLFYGINLDNFTINASLSTEMMSANRSISAGGLIGYAVGANVYLCSATNGEINIYGDNSYFSFAGGLIGYQQAFYMADYDMNYPSEIVYSYTDVDVNIMKGMALYAGGITGYLATNVPSGSTAFIHNSYSTGNVSGALRSGGIAGGLGQYTSVSNCYATGEIFARSSQSLDDLLLTDEEYCYANAGGIVGFAENDTIVNDSFFAGSTSASAPSEGCALTHDIIGGGYAKSYTSASAEKYVINNCITPSDLSDVMSDNNSLFKNTFGWVSAEWVFGADAYPTINYESSEGTITAAMTLRYVTADGSKVFVEGNEATTITFFDTANQSINIYAPMGNYFISGGIQRTIQSDNHLLSYGYFFDEACTQKVPYSYVPQRNIVLYIGFADPEPILGTHELIYGNSTEPLSITFDAFGFATYSDGKTEQISYYFYDGENILIEGARLARYFDGEIVIDEDATDVFADANFDLYRYNYYDFTGSLNNGTLELYDGVYFTKDNPLRAKSGIFRGEYYTVGSEGKTIYKFYGETATAENGPSYIEYTYTKAGDVITLTNDTTTVTLNESDLYAFDAFKGTWTKSATVNKSYAFDGMGGWTYQYVSYERSSNGYFNTYEKRIVEQKSGTYTVDGGILRLDDNSTTASFDGNGFLIIQENGTKQTYYTAHSYVGTWQLNNLTIDLLGIGQDGFGDAVLDYGDGMSYNLVYEVSETNGYVCLYWPHDKYTKDALFGYFVYDTATNTLIATLTDSNNLTTGYTQGNLFVIDDYQGEWICDVDAFKNIEFTFNGNGLYGFLYGYNGMEGELVLLNLTTNEETVLTYTLDSTLKGHFAYEGRRYVMEYNEDEKAVVLTAEGVNAQLQRKDALAKIEFVDTDGNTYYFDGRSNLSGVGGELTVNGTTKYAYVAVDDYWTIKDNGTEIGTMRLADNKEYYQLTLNNNLSNLYINNKFMGEWAIGGEFGTFIIGPTDLNGFIQANYKGYPVQIETLEPNLLTFKYKEDNMPITYYVFVVADELLGYDVLVLSQYPNLYSGGYSICTKANVLYGEWVRNDGDFTVVFDGITSGQYSYGIAYITRGGPGQTDYYYRTEERGVMMWSQTTLGGRTQYFKLEMLDLNTATDAELNADDVYVKRDALGNIVGAFRRVEADGLIFTVARDAQNNEYFFDGGNVDNTSGKLYVNDVYKYDYVIKSYNDNSTATIEVTDIETKITYTATLDYSVSGAYTMTIGNPVTA